MEVMMIVSMGTLDLVPDIYSLFIHFTFGPMKDRCALFVELTSPCVASGWGCVMVTGQFRMDQNINLTFN